MRPAHSISPAVVGSLVNNIGDYYVSPKVNGTYCIMEYGKFYTRHGEEMTDLTPHVKGTSHEGAPTNILSQLADAIANPDIKEQFKWRWTKSVVHGELYKGVFYPFDIVYYNALYCGDTPHGERRKITHMWMDYAIMLDPTLAPNISRPLCSDFICANEVMYNEFDDAELANESGCPDMEEIWRHHSKNKKHRHLDWPDLEGFVLKHKDMRFTRGNCMKMIKCRWK
jgi:ATP-dependent DNA ligase